MGDIANALLYVLTPTPLFFMFLGVCIGIVVGGIPGLTASMAIALTTPLTFYMDSTNALILLVSIYVGGISGSLISATLLRIPGTNASIMTTFDGYPMAQSGQPGRAIGIGITASFFGGFISWFFLFLLSPPLARFALKFGQFEYFALTLTALVFIAGVTQGRFIKGIMAGFLGVLISMFGIDPISGNERLTWGFHQLTAGFHLLPVLIGVFGISQLLKDCVDINKDHQKMETKFSGFFMSLNDLKRSTVNFVRSSVIGAWIGMLPGIGGNIASMIAYASAKSASKTPEKFGHGSEEGIVASETANNASINGALIPLITMGIPGSVADAMLMGALLIHNIQPGPMLFTNNPKMVYGIIFSAFFANIMMFFLMLLGTKIIAKALEIPKAYLIPILMFFCILGTYAFRNSWFDIWVLLGFGAVGFFLERCRVPLGPLAIGVVLAQIGERQLRSGLMASAGSFAPLFTRPIALFFVILSLAALCFVIYREIQTKRRENEKQDESSPRFPS